MAGITRPDEIILHIGPPKCASTTVQHALRGRKEELRAQGVRVITGHSDAISDLFGGKYLSDIIAARPGAWNELVRAVNRPGARRVIFSNEMLSFADEHVIARLLSSLGTSKISVLFAVRPLARILPSYWQERTKSGSTATLDEWATETVRREIGADAQVPSGRFWRAQRHDQLAARWSAALGTNRVRVAVLNETQPNVVLSTLAEALGVPATLFDGVTSVSNRSLTALESAALQQINVALASDPGARLLSRTVSGAVANRILRSDESGGPSLTLPGHLTDEVRALQAEVVRGLHASGVHINGDVEVLNVATERSPRRASDNSSDDAVVSVEAASRVVADGVLAALGVAGVVQTNEAWSSNGFTQRKALLPLRTMARAFMSALKYQLSIRMRRLRGRA